MRRQPQQGHDRRQPGHQRHQPDSRPERGRAGRHGWHGRHGRERGGRRTSARAAVRAAVRARTPLRSSSSGDGEGMGEPSSNGNGSTSKNSATSGTAEPGSTGSGSTGSGGVRVGFGRIRDHSIERQGIRWHGIRGSASSATGKSGAAGGGVGAWAGAADRMHNDHVEREREREKNQDASSSRRPGWWLSPPTGRHLRSSWSQVRQASVISMGRWSGSDNAMTLRQAQEPCESGQAALHRDRRQRSGLRRLGGSPPPGSRRTAQPCPTTAVSTVWTPLPPTSTEKLRGTGKGRYAERAATGFTGAHPPSAAVRPLA